MLSEPLTKMWVMVESLVPVRLNEVLYVCSGLVIVKARSGVGVGVGPSAMVNEPFCTPVRISELSEYALTDPLVKVIVPVPEDVGVSVIV